MKIWKFLYTLIALSTIFQKQGAFALELCQDFERVVLEELVTATENKLKALRYTLAKYLDECTLGKDSLNPGSSCEEIFASNNNKKEGEYWIRVPTHKPVKVYCSFNPIPIRESKGVRRIGYLDMTDSNQQCPFGFREVTSSSKRLCGRNMTQGGCNSITFKNNGIPYTTICGRVKAYQYASPSGFFVHGIYRFDIDGPYLEGVSITRGKPREHVWSFANALAERVAYPAHICPCIDSNYSTQQPFIPNFVGQDYFCDTGGTYRYGRLGVLYLDDPLWDGKGCHGSNTCCAFNNPPWFCKELREPVVDDIELRLCADEDALVNEDSPIEQYEIYVE